MFGSDKYKSNDVAIRRDYIMEIRMYWGGNVQNKITFQKTLKEDHRINLLIGTEVSSTKTENRGQKIYGYVAERGESVIRPTPIKELVPIGNAPRNRMGNFRGFV